ncbi:MAG TPA: glycosyltransferase [Bacteroidia bacterium]|nr:glycosyltransferase [Bacteroidia bacterium]
MKLLVVLSRVPYPLEKGDKLRAYNQIKELSKKNEIVLFAINDGTLHKDALGELNKYCSKVKIISLSKFQIFKNLIRGLFSKLPFQVAYFYFKKAQNEIDKIIQEENPNHIYCQLIRTSEYVRKHKEIPKTLDYMDVFSKGMERRKDKANAFLKPLFEMEHQRLLRYEATIFDAFDSKIIISQQDKNFIPHPRKAEIQVVPNGVDTDFFKASEKEKKYDLLFNGNMNYPPNVESVIYLVNKILPLVRQKFPQIRLLISGASPSQKVLALQSSHVFVSGWVNDIRTNFYQSKILVAPMQISIGLQNKLLEAMAMKIPCVTSTLANNALGAENGKEILVADEPEIYAKHILFLLENPEKAKAIAQNGFQFVVKNYTWENSVNKLQGIFESVKK